MITMTSSSPPRSRSCLLLVLFLLGSTVSVVRSQQDTNGGRVPGCDCPATACGGSGGLAAVCSPATANAPYIDTTTSDPICDVVDNSEQYQTDFGNLSQPYFFGDGTGPYLPTNLVSTVVGQGTCADAYAAQSSCGADSTLSSAASAVDPGSCGQFTVILPDSNETQTMHVSSVCKAYFSDETEYGMDVFYTVQSKEFSDSPDSVDLCDKDGTSQVTSANLSPVLTSSDWMSDQPGRHYMCSEVTDGLTPANTYYIFVLGLGNLPCTGPESTPTPAPSGGRSVVGNRGVGLFAVTASVLAMMLLNIVDVAVAAP
mmetsp:Transcript_4259/g.10629  ORF Transcript_4259/g.10629 Transcript_4259/m.10629 type:complete len:314 (+) Transcript_4259:2325-3266(+)